MTTLPDPRFSTVYADDYKGVLFYNQPCPQNFLMPASAYEKWCEPGYQPKRPDKGVALTVNDYPFHPIQYGGSRWPLVVYTNLVDDN